jgi:hypothetical protein
MTDPVNLSLKEITETKHLLETLITSSESFDYVGAKAALQQLREKVRILGKFQADLFQQQQQLVRENRVVQFPVCLSRDGV